MRATVRAMATAARSAPAASGAGAGADAAAVAAAVQLEATFDQGEEEGYGIWLDPAVKDDPTYAEHWEGHKALKVTIEPERIVLERSRTEVCAAGPVAEIDRHAQGRVSTSISAPPAAEASGCFGCHPSARIVLAPRR